MIAESTPGPIAINCATYAGYKLAGMAGAVIANLGIVLPPFVIISIFLDNFMEYPLIAKAFQGTKAAVGLLVLDAGITMMKKAPRKMQPRIIAACAFAVMLLVNVFSWRISSVSLMFLAALVSLAAFCAKARGKAALVYDLSGAFFGGGLKVGCFTFGGAYSAIPLVRDTVLSHGWLSEETLTDMVAVSESTPGLMVNLATYVGSRQAGFGGAVLATAAVVMPPFFVIVLIVSQLKGLLKSKYIQVALQGLKPCMIGIILATGTYMMFHCCFPSTKAFADMRTVLMMLAPISVSVLHQYVRKKKLSPISLIILSAIPGAIVY